MELTSPRGRIVYLGKDSITKQDGYYFYNMKFLDPKFDDFVILTMQSGVKHQFSARLKAYKPSEYESLNGDYENITKNMTQNLEMVTYDSIVNTCYRKIKELMEKDVLPKIEL